MRGGREVSLCRFGINELQWAGAAGGGWAGGGGALFAEQPSSLIQTRWELILVYSAT